MQRFYHLYLSGCMVLYHPFINATDVPLILCGLALDIILINIYLVPILCPAGVIFDAPLDSGLWVQPAMKEQATHCTRIRLSSTPFYIPGWVLHLNWVYFLSFALCPDQVC